MVKEKKIRENLTSVLLLSDVNFNSLILACSRVPLLHVMVYCLPCDRWARSNPPMFGGAFCVPISADKNIDPTMDELSSSGFQ